MRLLKSVFLFAVIVNFIGCASTTYRASPNYPNIVKEIKTLAVMPPDVKMFEISAGGMTQQMDEWSETAKVNITQALKKEFADRYEIKIKFIDEKWLKDNYAEAWRKNRSLYNAVSNSAYSHGFPGVGSFPHKLEKFDYTLGPEITQLSAALEADALLFVWGVDYEVTGGRAAVEFFQAALVGVYYFHPSILTMGLVNSKTGDLDWISIPSNSSEYNFRNPKHIESLVRCLTSSYAKKE